MYLQRAFASSIRSDPPPTLRLPSSVTMMFEIVQPHSTSLLKPERGDSFLRSAPAGHEPGVDASKPRVTLICVDESMERS